jgi:type I restriction-modification system DNA methylase subunit
MPASISKEKAYSEIKALVDKFESLDDHQRRRYNEPNTRKDFVMPLFRALGWDVEDAAEVSEEEKVSRGRVDYAFRLRGIPCFFLEAKAIPVDLDEARWAVQAITYAYNKGVTWAVLTDFEGLKVFNVDWDVPEVMRSRFLDLTYRDYVEDFDKLWWLSKESFLENRLAKEAAKVGAARKRVPVGERLYGQFREWRELLFKYLFKYNRDRTLRDIDEAIQRILDRLIFIRTCEDRGIEEPVLLPLLRQWKARAIKRDLWDELKETFKHFDMVYNSRLFQPHLCDLLECEATPFETVLQELYSRESEVVRYDFSAIGVDVLGRVYEQYLGHVARVAQVVAEEEAKRRSLMAHLPSLAPKPELTIELAAKKIKRKEHGIYYTPQFVVDYIAEHTVEAFLRDCTKEQAERVRILDPACGSGSFLLTAYERLMKYFAELQQLPVLPQKERLEILTRSIYGVDLDAQAVEIAQLNLLLKALEEPALLPDLSENIRRGNSLISGGADELREYFGDEWEGKRPFNWEQEVPEIMADGGFDIVIGNPPYLGFQSFKEDKPYLRSHYLSAVGRFDVYLPFIERGIALLRNGGLLGFICPINFTKRGYGRRLRKFLRNNVTIMSVVDFQDVQIFEGALNYTGIFIFEKSPPQKQSEFYYVSRSIEGDGFHVRQATLTDEAWIFRNPTAEELIQKVKNQRIATLGELTVGISEGIVTGKNDVFLLEQSQVDSLGLESEIVKPCLRGRQIRRYLVETPTEFVVYPYSSAAGETRVIPPSEMRSKHSHVWNYLLSQQKNLAGRPYFERSSKAWYELWCQRNINQQNAMKILVPELSDSNRFALADEHLFYGDTVCGITLEELVPESILYVLGVLNSRLIEYFYKQTTVPKANKFYIYKTMFLKGIPIRRINFDDPEEKAMHDQMVRLVERMLELHRRKVELRDTLTEELREVEREIERMDGQIDALVYELYGLTEKEIALIEGAGEAR